MRQAITIERVHVAHGMLTLQVRAAEGARQTDARIAAQAAEDFPDLPSHSCVNPKGPAFGNVMTDTSVPHLLEHLIIDLQVAAEPANSRATFAGHTTWLDEEAGQANITVKFRSDACALQAAMDACTYLNALLA